MAMVPLPPPERVTVPVERQEARPRTQSGALSASALRNAFDGLDYSLEAVAQGETEVPQLHLSAIPRDLRRIADVEKRKDLFLRMMLPLILAVNDEIADNRQRLVGLQRHLARGATLPRSDAEWVAALNVAYGQAANATIASLLRRVDRVPPSLALAQAATESGWGVSQLAQKGNVLFGQTAGPSETAAIAVKDGSNRVFRYRSFTTPIDAVRAYIHNLNTHPAYNEFRQMRAYQRKRGSGPEGLVLVSGLQKYAEHSRYVEALRMVIRTNDLDGLDEARLADAGVRLRY